LRKHTILMRFITLIFVWVASVIWVSCNESNSKAPDSTGRSSEILVVCSNTVWAGPLGDSIRAALTSTIQGLPEAEPEFTLIHILQKDFSRVLQSHRNILMADVDAGNKKSKVETHTNVWSHPQRVVKVKAGSDTAFLNLFVSHGAAILELFKQNERARFSAVNTLNGNPEIAKQLNDDFGISMIISRDFYLAKKTKDFVWLRSEATTMSLGLMIYTIPYKDTAQLNPASVVATRDRYARLYVPGPLAGSYMTTEKDNYTPLSQKILFKEMYAIETRGLWKTEGDFMGGPFINYSIVDAPRHRIIVFDGYVYNPNKTKRDYIRQLESIIWAAQFGDPAVTKSK
jgi:hypothetical protein